MYEVSFDADEFMTNYWQQHALVLKQGMGNFVDPLSPQELADLAMKSEIQSCLVTCHEQQWRAQLGPFKDFAVLSESHSTLLLRGVDHWHLRVNSLAEAFKFIPNWRFSEIAISYSTVEGGLGPQVESSCVFVIQGKGRRRWRVGAKQIINEFNPCEHLRHCEPFEAVMDVVLEPGDVLYIPPGCPHQAYTLEAAMNYSINFSAPNALELIGGFANYLQDKQPPSTRFTDPKRHTTQEYGRIAEHETQALNKMMVKLLSSPEFNAQFLGEYLSKTAFSLNLSEFVGSQQPLQQADLQEWIEQGVALRRSAGVKALYLDVLPYQIFVDGQRYAVPNCAWALAKSMCNHHAIDAHSLRAFKQDSHQFDWLLDLLNRGYWYFDSVK